MHIDEQIAKLEQAKRLLQEEAETPPVKNEEETEVEKELTQQEINHAIDSGLLKIENRKFEFVKKVCLGNKIQIPMIDNYFQILSDTVENLALKQEEEGVTILLNLVPGKNTGAGIFKKGMEQNFKNMGLYIEWLEDGEVKKDKGKIQYFTFLTPTGMGNVYNLIFFYNMKNKILIGNLNCPYKDIKLWEKIFKAMVQLIII